MNMTWTQNMGKNKGGKDEWYTPIEAVRPIIPYLKPGASVLCPFDTAESEFVKELTRKGFIVTHSHIEEGKDFFELEKPNVDYIISNPPFSLRDRILKRLYEWDIPFAMIFNMNGLFDSQNRANLARGGGRNNVPISESKIYR